MNLIPRKPFKEVEDFFSDDDWFFPVFQKRDASPEIDVYETDKAVMAEISAPGMTVEDLDVSVENNLLKVKGEKEEKKEDSEKGYYRKEIRKGSFERVVRLPSNIDESKVTAEYKNGILKVEIPKAERKKENKSKLNPSK